MNPLKFAALFVLVCGLSQAQDHGFRYKRKITAGDAAGWHAIPLPPEMYAHTSRRLSDLRLYRVEEQDTVEIPYLVRERTEATETEEIALPVINNSVRDGMLFLTLNNTKRKLINHVTLDFGADNYFANATVEGSNNGKEWFTLAEGLRIFSIVRDGDTISQKELTFSPTDYAWLRLQIKADTNLSLMRASVQHVATTPGKYRNIGLRWSVHEDRDQKQTMAYITLDHYQPVSHIALTLVHEMDFYRPYVLDFVADSTHTGKGWRHNYRRLATGYLTSYTPNTVATHEVLARQLRLTIDNGDSPALTITDIEARGAVVELVARLPHGVTDLYYGDAKLNGPSYDLKWFEEKIPDSLSSADVGNEEAIFPSDDGNTAFAMGKAWLWLAMATAISVLAFFTWRMLMSKPVQG